MEKAKKIGKWLLIIFSGFLLLVLLLIIIVFAFEDKIKAYAVERINQNLNTEIKVSQIDLTIISSFPFASLDFKDVLILDPITVNKYPDTMLYAKELSFEFSVWDIFGGDYSVKEMIIRDAEINLYIDENGNENYHFWKDSDEKSDEKFEFDLQKVTIENTNITYRNKYNNEDYSFFTKQTLLSGNFKEKEFDLNTDSKLFIEHFKSGKVALMRNKNTHLQLDIHVDLPNDKLTFKTGKLKIEDLVLGVSGWIGIGDTTFCDLGIKTNKVGLSSIYRIFPKNFSQHLLHYDSKGEVKIDANIKGEISKIASPVIHIDFSVADGSMKEKESGVKLTKLHFNGHYTNFNDNETDEIVLKELSGKFLDGSFKAEVGIRNFTDPKIKLDVSGDFNLTTLHKFLRPPRIEAMSGELHASIHLLSSINSENQSMELISAAGKARVKDGTITSKSLALHLTSLNGLIEIKNNDASIEGLSGMKGQSDFEINGVIKNFMPYALKENQHINIVASLVSENIRLEDFLGKENESATSSTAPATAAATSSTAPATSSPATDYYFPSFINFNLDASVGKLTYGEFVGKKLSGNFKLLDKKFTAKNLELRMAEGSCEGNLTVDGTGDNGFIIETKQKASDINISKLFTLFENFGQEEIKAENLGGRMNADIEFFGWMDNRLNLNPASVVTTAKLEITDGELKDFLLLGDVVKYLRDAKILAKLIGKKNLDRLEKQVKHVKFLKLSNTIEIRKEEILIPDMILESNVMDLNLSGKHSFKNDIDYQLDFRFKDLKLDKESETEVEKVRKDNGKGLRVFLHITGTVNEPIYDFDLKEFLSGINLKTDIKEKLATQKTEIKSALKADLGLFKKDSAIKAKETPKEEVKFLYDWDEGKTEADETTSPEEKKEKERQRVKKQKEKNRVTEKKEQVKFTFEQE